MEGCLSADCNKISKRDCMVDDAISTISRLVSAGLVSFFFKSPWFQIWQVSIRLS